MGTLRMNTRVSENGVKSQLRGKPEKEAVETAIGASRTDDGTVQTANLQKTAKAVAVRKSVVLKRRVGSTPTRAI